MAKRSGNWFTKEFMPAYANKAALRYEFDYISLEAVIRQSAIYMATAIGVAALLAISVFLNGALLWAVENAPRALASGLLLAIVLLLLIRSPIIGPSTRELVSIGLIEESIRREALRERLSPEGFKEAMRLDEVRYWRKESRYRDRRLGVVLLLFFGLINYDYLVPAISYITSLLPHCIFSCP